MKPSNIPAFPHRAVDGNVELGMSLRDYFAAKAPMPNAAEASEIMGVKCRESVEIPDDADFDKYKAWKELPRFDEVWKRLTNRERAAVCAEFQFLYADALLREREKGEKP